MIIKSTESEMPEIQLHCSCYSHGFSIAWDEEMQYYYFSTWHYGRSTDILDWKQRLRWIWRILRTGNPWTDEIILSQEKLDKIIEFAQKIKSRKQTPVSTCNGPIIQSAVVAGPADSPGIL